MKTELRYGRLRYVSFVLLDFACLILANILAVWIYLKFSTTHYGFNIYRPVVVIMLIIDLLVTIILNTLNRVLRRGTKKEIQEAFKHIGASFVILAVVLFSVKQGSVYSRAIVYMAYCIYFCFFVGIHFIWKRVLTALHKKSEHETAILMTTDGFVEEGLEELKKLNVDVRYIWLLKNIQRYNINDVHVVRSDEEAASAICWEMLDKVYIYGLEHQMIPERLKNEFKEMGLTVNLVDFNYRVIDVNTIRDKDSKFGALSFLEGKRDIPFSIRRVYWITETEADLHRGFHAHKQNCQLLFCPYGKIDIILDDGQKKTTVSLDKPEKGLLLMPGLWREMVWQQSGSVLCVLASEYYDAEEYIRNYDEFIEYNKNYRDSTDPLKQK